MKSPPAIPITVLLVEGDADAGESLRHAAVVLESFGVGATFAPGAWDVELPTVAGDCCAVIVASPDGALPAAVARGTSLPVIRVPTPGGGRDGAQLLDDGGGNLPAGAADAVFATMAIGEAGAKNAALFVVSALAGTDERIRAAWSDFRARQTDAVRQHPALELDA